MNPPQPAPAGTRERILAYLEENRTATVIALSRAWGLTRADIRYHINHLIEEGLVERVENPVPGATARAGNAKPAPRGRPTAIYRLSARSAPDNFPRLACALLQAVLDPLPEEAREAVLRSLAEKLAVGAGPDSPRLTSARFNQAVETLNGQSYRARWEASPAGPRFLLRSCPYAALIEERPELCSIDRYLLESLTGLSLRQTARMSAAPGGPPACVFLPR